MQNETDLIFKPDMVIKSRDEIKPFLLNSLPKSGTHLMLKLLRKILGENSLDFHLGKERKSILLAGRTVKAVKSPLVWIHRQWWITKR